MNMFSTKKESTTQHIKVVFAALATMFLVSACGSLTTLKPTAKIKSASIANIDFEQLTLAVDVGVTNPNPIALRAEGMTLDLMIDGKKITQVVNNEGLQLNARGSSSQQLMVAIPFKSIYAAVSHLKDKNEFEYSIDGNINLNVPALGNIALPLAYKNSAPVPKKPEVSFSDIRVTDTSFTKISLAFDMTIKNPNTFGMNLAKPAFNLAVNNTKLANIDAKDINLEANKESTVTLTSSLNLLDMSNSIVRAIIAKEALQWSVDAKASMSSKDLNMPAQLIEFSKNEWKSNN
jgi:LEA14-like dessication related protein